jgi:hypothetical protein
MHSLVHTLVFVSDESVIFSVTSGSPAMPPLFPIDIIKYGTLASVLPNILKVQINTTFYTKTHIRILPNSIKSADTVCTVLQKM